jgi:GNAT superfamily N-acetyltransferase
MMRATTLAIHTADELYHRVRTEKCNRDLFREYDIDGREVRRLHYLCPRSYHKQTHFTLSIGKRIVAIGSVEMYPDYPTRLCIAHISVEDKHRGKKFARRILEAIYEYAVSEGRVVESSQFSEMGQRLKHIHVELDAKYPAAACGEPHRDSGSVYRRNFHMEGE